MYIMLQIVSLLHIFKITYFQNENLSNRWKRLKLGCIKYRTIRRNRNRKYTSKVQYTKTDLIYDCTDANKTDYLDNSEASNSTRIVI